MYFVVTTDAPVQDQDSMHISWEIGPKIERDLRPSQKVKSDECASDVSSCAVARPPKPVWNPSTAGHCTKEHSEDAITEAMSQVMPFHKWILENLTGLWRKVFVDRQRMEQSPLGFGIMMYCVVTTHHSTQPVLHVRPLFCPEGFVGLQPTQLFVLPAEDQSLSCTIGTSRLNGFACLKEDWSPATLGQANFLVFQMFCLQIHAQCTSCQN